jgi:hypothetical protein
MEKKSKKRNPVYALQLSLMNAKEFYEKLCEVHLKIEETSKRFDINREEWRDPRILQKALWIALIIEIGRLFDDFRETESKKVISFKKIFKDSPWKGKIDTVYGSAVISKIIETRNTFMAHISEEQKEIISVSEICNSNLNKLLNELDAPLSAFVVHFIDNHGWENL